jgi:hypothetical protein
MKGVRFPVIAPEVRCLNEGCFGIVQAEIHEELSNLLLNSWNVVFQHFMANFK